MYNLGSYSWVHILSVVYNYKGRKRLYHSVPQDIHEVGSHESLYMTREGEEGGREEKEGKAEGERKEGRMDLFLITLSLPLACIFKCLGRVTKSLFLCVYS